MSETRDRLLDAAERLFAEKGMHGTSAREIVAAAGQRNESAIQYHFGGRDGLVDALLARRIEAIETERLARLDALAEQMPEADVRALLAAIVDPVIERCRDDAGFRAFLAAFGELVLAPGFALSGNPFEMRSLGRLRERLEALLDLPSSLLSARAEALTRFVLLNLCQWARSGVPFDGPELQRFFTNFMDMGAAMLAADVSSETRAAWGDGLRETKEGGQSR